MAAMLFVLLGLRAACHLQAQEIAAPDYILIRHHINNAKSENYYPNLMRRYIENDSTLSLQQYRYLYYGYTLREDFVPYQAEKQKLFDIRRQLVATQGDPVVCPEAIRIAKAMLDDNPFDIPAISTIAIAYLQQGDTAHYRLWDDKQRCLLDAILSSGDGDTPETAFHVISLEHEYEVLNRLGLEVAGDSLCNDQIEYLRVKENVEGEHGFYFNFGACRRVYREKYEQ